MELSLLTACETLHECRLHAFSERSQDRRSPMGFETGTSGYKTRALPQCNSIRSSKLSCKGPLNGSC
jgi:hypothetical protein